MRDLPRVETVGDTYHFHQCPEGEVNAEVARRCDAGFDLMSHSVFPVMPVLAGPGARPILMYSLLFKKKGR